MAKYRKQPKRHKKAELNELDEKELEELNQKRIVKAVRAASKLSKRKKITRVAPGEIADEQPCVATLTKDMKAMRLVLRVTDGLSRKELAYVAIQHDMLIELMTGSKTRCSFRMFNLGFLGLRKEMKRLEVTNLPRMKLGGFKRWYRETVLPLEVNGWRAMRQSKIDAATALLKRATKTERPDVKIKVVIGLVRWVPKDYQEGDENVDLEQYRPKRKKRTKEEPVQNQNGTTAEPPAIEEKPGLTGGEMLAEAQKAAAAVVDEAGKKEATPTVGAEIKDQMVEHVKKLRSRKRPAKKPPAKKPKRTPAKRVSKPKTKKSAQKKVAPKKR